ncbi:MAG: restriction endonuclease, partial [Thaumarchaeota archaeon]|nr:restriction endonuclease [Nitrososphaerota archaeon]
YFDSAIEEKLAEIDDSKIDTKTPDDLMQIGFRKIQVSLEEELLDTIKKQSPQFFEKLILELCEKMLHGKGEVTGRTGDGGIDGIIRADVFGLDTTYLQAKKWENNVSEPQIRDFAGSLDSHKSNKGIFITTADFASPAKRYVEQITKKIILINGRQLVKHMIEYDVGVKKSTAYEIKKINPEFFEE